MESIEILNKVQNFSKADNIPVNLVTVKVGGLSSHDLPSWLWLFCWASRLLSAQRAAHRPVSIGSTCQLVEMQH